MTDLEAEPRKTDAFITKSREDEVFVARDLGIVVQVWRLIDHVNESADLQPSLLPTDNLVSQRLPAGLDTSWLSRIGEGRLEEPLLVWKPDARVVILDGNHRLERRRQLGLETTRAYVLPTEVVAAFSEPWG